MTCLPTNCRSMMMSACASADDYRTAASFHALHVFHMSVLVLLDAIFVASIFTCVVTCAICVGISLPVFVLVFTQTIAIFLIFTGIFHIPRT